MAQGRRGDRPIDLALSAEYRVCVRSGSSFDSQWLAGIFWCVWVDGLRSVGSIGTVFGVGMLGYWAREASSQRVGKIPAGCITLDVARLGSCLLARFGSQIRELGQTRKPWTSTRVYPFEYDQIFWLRLETLRNTVAPLLVVTARWVSFC